MIVVEKSAINRIFCALESLVLHTKRKGANIRIASQPTSADI